MALTDIGLCARALNTLVNPSAGRGFIKAMEVDILARTLWGEGRSEGARGMHAICNVILNRFALTQA